MSGLAQLKAAPQNFASLRHYSHQNIESALMEGIVVLLLDLSNVGENTGRV